MTTRLTRDQTIRHNRRAAAAARGCWPIPTDTPTDRARTLANALHTALTKTDPGKAEEIRVQAHRFGETWLGPQGAGPDGPWLTINDVAQLAGVRPSAVRNWGTRGTRAGHLRRHPDGYLEREVVDYIAAWRRTRSPSGTTPQETTR